VRERKKFRRYPAPLGRGASLLLGLIQPILPTNFKLENLWFKRTSIWFFYLGIAWIISSYLEYQKIKIKNEKLEKKLENKVDYKIKAVRKKFEDWFDDKTLQAEEEIKELEEKIKKQKMILDSLIPQFGVDTPEQRIEKLKEYIKKVEEYKKTYKNFLKIYLLIQNIGIESDEDINIIISSEDQIFQLDISAIEEPKYPEKHDSSWVANRMIQHPIATQNTNKKIFREILHSDNNKTEVELSSLRVKEKPAYILDEPIIIDDRDKINCKVEIVSKKTKQPIEEIINLN